MRILIAGIGNMFLADDGFGVELAQRLTEHEFPAEVTVADYGISGMHLAYDLLTGYDTTILLDATPRGDEPGTITIVELDADHPFQGGQSAVDAHGMQPEAVLELLTLLGGKPGRMILLGCEPAEITDRIGLSAPVAAALDGAAQAVIELVDQELAIREGV
ncbi:MAG TPA: hydrogenase maturation protease [Pseudonocardiaceae bacterium]|jgi:hydrogenase maturation protease|nr:hydrogenase maturation protease [Pseudonocardiaceae bacterium]